MGSLFLSPAPLRDPLNPDRPPDTVLSTYGDLPPPASSPSTPTDAALCRPPQEHHRTVRRR